MNLGVGLGLPGLKPGIESKALVANALINRSRFKFLPQGSLLFPKIEFSINADMRGLSFL